MRKLLYFISNYLPCKIIRGDSRSPYMERYYLFTLFGRRFYLHRFLGGDVDESTHNHPWRQSYALIITGEYREAVGSIVCRDGQSVLQVETLCRRPLQLNTIDSEHLHKIEWASPETWTLFWHTAERIQDWGFLEGDAQAGFAIRPHQSSHTVRWELQAVNGRHCPNRLPYAPLPTRDNSHQKTER